MNDQWYFKVEDVLQEFSIRSHVEKNGFKPYIDKLLAEQGGYVCLFDKWPIMANHVTCF